MRKYRIGKRIKTMAEFSRSNSRFFMVSFGRIPRTIHRSFLESWQYHTLDMFIKRGQIWVAEKKEAENGK